MSTSPEQAPKEQSDAKAEDLAPDQPGSESPEAEGEEEEEQGECGFCLFMKGGGCKDAFINWENCIQEAENNNEDLVEKCAQVTAALKQCMDAHSDYYEPILRAEKLAEEQAIIELEKEKEKENSEPNQEQNPSHSNQHQK
ncbi:hypothetical protein VNO77_04493 [Canavalia gladiata]|uniref:GCK domain-containing protein n=1 Tax=Canavalia gladiata TaxID=3824 RepID=A0AAN9MX98_CANGL